MQLQEREQAAVADTPITLMDKIDESVRRGDYTPEAGLILKALHKLENNPTASDVARHKVMTEAFLKTPTRIGQRLH
jgi:hypothetical protein